MSLAIRAHYEPIRELLFSSITSTYHTVGSSLSHSARNITLYNGTDKLMMFSWDGISGWVVLPPLGYFIWDITSNKTIPQGFFVPEGSTLYVKTETINPTTGKVYFSVMYGAEL